MKPIIHLTPFSQLPQSPTFGISKPEYIKQPTNSNKVILRPSSHLQQKQTINITNKLSRYNLNFGSEFKSFLEPRDQVLEHSFDFSIPVTPDALFQLQTAKVPESINEKIKDFLVESAGNITSAAFKFLCKGQLTEEQAKEYASKNIFLNLNSILKETIKGIKEVEGIGLKIKEEETVTQILASDGLKTGQIQHILYKNWEELGKHQQALQAEGMQINYIKQKLANANQKRQKITEKLTFQADNLMNDILVNLADNFPQAPPSGGTPRMRDSIIDLNRVQDEQNDFIFANTIEIGQFISGYKKGQKFEYGTEDRDYTRFIMQVINTAIRVTQSSSDDKRQRTVKDIFTEFNEKLFCLSQEDQYHPLIKSLDDEEHTYQGKAEEKQKIIQFFDETLSQETFEIRGINALIQRLCQIGDKYEGDSLNFEKLNMKDKLEQFRAKGSNTYGFGQKIPSFVKQFSRQEIVNRQFSSRHSSILRILTKWSEYLEAIFANPQKTVLKRAHPFKTIDNQLVEIKHDSDGNQRLIQQLKQQHQQVKKKFEAIAKNCYRLMGNLLTQQDKVSSCVGRYAEARSVASKINAVLTHHMLIYVNTLIHHLLKAGEKIRINDYLYNHINLVVFRVSDLLRAKLQCSQSSFISLLKTMYLLDSDSEMRGKFKLVRIKNKLQDSANNIMINYLFMGKVLCELQLSIQQPKGKAKNYYAFSHFIYELTRGKFGAIAQCAIMISQLDPMITSCKQNYYVQKKGTKIISLSDEVKEQVRQFESKLKSAVFECPEQNCKKLIINQGQSIFKYQGSHKICNNCVILSQEHPEEQLKDEKLKKCLQSKAMIKILNFGQLKDEQDTKCLAILNNQGNLTFNLSIFVEEELKTFLIKIDEQILQRLGTSALDFSTLDYFDITKKIKDQAKSKKKEQILFVIQNPFELPEELYELMNLNKQTALSRIQDMEAEFKQFRQEKALIKTIKFKVGVVNANYNINKWETLGNIAEQLALPLHQTREKEIILRYKKYKHLELSSLSLLYARCVGLTDLPKWFPWLKNLKFVTLEDNQLSVIRKQQLPTSLIDLNIRQNGLIQIDVSDLIHLTTLDLESNKLETINVSNLIHLTCLNLGGNKFEKIDLVNLVNLKQLRLHVNKLKEINLSTLSKLQQLSLYKNQLNDLDLTSNNKLVALVICNNQLTDIQYLPESLKLLHANRKTILNYDFEGMTNLNKLAVWNGQTQRDEILHLRESVEFCSR